MSGKELDGRQLDELFAVIESRRTADPAQSHTAALLRSWARRRSKR
jgi:phosphoribosyl-ATP pyrophosphohydrolase